MSDEKDTPGLSGAKKQIVRAFTPHTVLVVSALVFFLFTGDIVHAQESASSSPSLSPQVAENILTTASNLNKKIEATANRLENIGGRIKSRTTLMENVGVDTDEVYQPLIQGTYLATEVKRLLPEVDGLVKEMVIAEKPYAVDPGMISNRYETIKGLLLESHKELLKALSVLKSLSTTKVEGTDSATTTSSTTTTI